MLVATCRSRARGHHWARRHPDRLRSRRAVWQHRARHVLAEAPAPGQHAGAARAGGEDLSL